MKHCSFLIDDWIEIPSADDIVEMLGPGNVNAIDDD